MQLIGIKIDRALGVEKDHLGKLDFLSGRDLQGKRGIRKARLNDHNVLFGVRNPSCRHAPLRVRQKVKDRMLPREKVMHAEHRGCALAGTDTARRGAHLGHKPLPAARAFVHPAVCLRIHLVFASVHAKARRQGVKGKRAVGNIFKISAAHENAALLGKLRHKSCAKPLVGIKNLAARLGARVDGSTVDHAEIARGKKEPRCAEHPSFVHEFFYLHFFISTFLI